MIYHHQLKAINPLSFQILDLKYKLEKPSQPTIFFLHCKLNFIIIMFFSNFLAAFLILSGCSFEGLICLIWRHKKHFSSLFMMLTSPFLDLLIQQISLWLYVFIISRTRLRMNPHSIVAWMSRNFFLEAGAKSEV